MATCAVPCTVWRAAHHRGAGRQWDERGASGRISRSLLTILRVASLSASFQASCERCMIDATHLRFLADLSVRRSMTLPRHPIITVSCRFTSCSRRSLMSSSLRTATTRTIALHCGASKGYRNMHCVCLCFLPSAVNRQSTLSSHIDRVSGLIDGGPGFPTDNPTLPKARRGASANACGPSPQSTCSPFC